MRNRPHGTRNLICCSNTTDLALGTHRGWQSVLIRLEDGGLMEADSGSVYAHVCKDNVWVCQARGQFEVSRKTKRRVQKDVVQVSVSFPEFAVQVVVSVIDIRPVEMEEIAAE